MVILMESTKTFVQLGYLKIMWNEYFFNNKKGVSM